jgi:hypothetical protein
VKLASTEATCRSRQVNAMPPFGRRAMGLSQETMTQ